MALVMRAAPAAEAITAAEAKAYLRVDGGNEDALIASLILTSRLHIEAALGMALMTQEWSLVLDRWPEGDELRLPLRPVQEVSEVRVFDEAGNASVVASADYLVDTAGTPPRLVAKRPWPKPGQAANGIEIDLTVGHGDAPADVPEPMRQALLLLVAHWYEHRDPIEIGGATVKVPADVSRLLQPFRMVRL